MRRRSQALAEMPGVGFWHMAGCNMDDVFAFAYQHRTNESWEREQADNRAFNDQMDQQWDLAKQWGLPPLYSAPKPNDGYAGDGSLRTKRASFRWATGLPKPAIQNRVDLFPAFRCPVCSNCQDGGIVAAEMGIQYF